MNIGLVITCHNRPRYFAKCLESLQTADLHKLHCIVVVNDASTDPETIRLFREFNINGVPIVKITNDRNLKVYGSLKRGFDKAFDMGCTAVTNLDSDAIIKPEFVERIAKGLFLESHDHVVTGFNSRNKNRDGSDRHPVIEERTTHLLKKSVGGINFAFTQNTYNEIIRPILERCEQKGGNWDHLACIASMKAGRPIVCLTPSCVQHIGFESSMGHSEPADVACDFFSIDLPEVTLVGVDCADARRLVRAADYSMKDIRFATVKLFTSIPVKDERIIKCHPIKSKQAYSHFIIKDLAPHIETSHCLIIQYDGFVLNWQSWKKEWLQYDYIGATWWYKDGMNVGNGGFSLRSKKLMDILSKDPQIANVHPEDDVICRQYRRYLESNHGIKFAPEEVANRFSIEAYSVPSPHNRYSGQFGFHGNGVDFSGTNYEGVNQYRKR